MIADIFVNQYPLIVTGGFTSACVMAFSVANLFGRLYWSSLSDRVGRLNIFKLFTLASVPLYLSIPLICSYLPYTTSAIPLAVFLASSSIIFSFFGGIYSVCPAFESDLFGSKYFGAIHGRMLTASAFGAISGPIVLAKLREMSEISAIKDLASKVSPDLFLERFGAPISNLDSLISTKVVTISELLSILPSDVIDPSPFLYNTTMYTAATLVSLAAIITFSIRPVDPKYYEKSSIIQSSTIQSIETSQSLKKNEEAIDKASGNEVNQKKNIE
jgi:MFS family permease